MVVEPSRPFNGVQAVGWIMELGCGTQVGLVLQRGPRIEDDCLDAWRVGSAQVAHK